MGEEIALDRPDGEMHGTFVGVDERFGMLLRQGGDTRLLPLTGLPRGDDDEPSPARSISTRATCGSSTRPRAPASGCISGGFEFSNWSEGDLAGKARQAFANGWLGVETFGRVTFVAVTRIEADEMEALARRLAEHFVEIYGAPSIDAALGTAREEMAQMAELCEDHAPNTLLTVARELTEAGVKESFRAIEADDAGLEQFAIHPDNDLMQ